MVKIQKKTVQKYSSANNTWRKVADITYDIWCGFRACSFMDIVYFIIANGTSCIMFNTTTGEWRQVARPNKFRLDVSCTVFEGRVVVSGGLGFCNSVEAYDHVAEAWYDMPNMVQARCGHKSVAIRNKLFVIAGIGTTTIELFDSNCNKFVLVKPPTVSVADHLLFTSAVVTLGNKLVIFNNRKNNILLYDVENDEFSEEKCEAAKVCRIRCSAKVPRF